MNLDEFLEESNMVKSDALKSGADFAIKQGRYEGPYTKLLSMIEAKKLSISELSLSKIADEYIEYIKSLENVNPLDLSQFVQVASTLMLIKAKSLLPTIEYTKEEVEQVDSLEKKLELLKELKAAEQNVNNIFAKNIMLNKKRSYLINQNINSSENINIVYEKPKSLTKENIYSVAMLTLAKMPNFERLKQVAVRQAIRIEKVIERIMEHISGGISSLKEFAKNFDNGVDTSNNLAQQKEFKKSIIVSFLAILELLKSGVIDAVEKDGDIEITKRLK